MTEIVGIVNVTPDSFSDGGKWVTRADALKHARQLLEQGASIIDIGGESTRPQATPVSRDEEWERIGDVCLELIKQGARISVDTYHPETLKRLLEQTDLFIANDVTGFYNPQLRAAAAHAGLRCIVSHLPLSAEGDIQRAHAGPLVDRAEQVVEELRVMIDQLIAAGVRQTNIIVDPGIGFGKTPELNRQLLTFARLMPDYPVMIGYSRKRFLGDQRMAITPNLEAAKLAIAAGAAYLRVHDVAAHVDLLKKLKI